MKSKHQNIIEILLLSVLCMAVLTGCGKKVRDSKDSESITSESITSESITGESITGESITSESMTSESKADESENSESKAGESEVSEYIDYRDYIDYTDYTEMYLYYNDRSDMSHLKKVDLSSIDMDLEGDYLAESVFNGDGFIEIEECDYLDLFSEAVGYAIHLSNDGTGTFDWNDGSEIEDITWDLMTNGTSLFVRVYAERGEETLYYGWDESDNINLCLRCYSEDFAAAVDGEGNYGVKYPRYIPEDTVEGD